MEESKLRQNLKFRQDFPFFQPIPVQPLMNTTFKHWFTLRKPVSAWQGAVRCKLNSISCTSGQGVVATILSLFCHTSHRFGQQMCDITDERERQFQHLKGHSRENVHWSALFHQPYTGPKGVADRMPCKFIKYEQCQAIVWQLFPTWLPSLPHTDIVPCGHTVFCVVLSTINGCMVKLSIGFCLVIR